MGEPDTGARDVLLFIVSIALAIGTVLIATNYGTVGCAWWLGSILSLAWLISIPVLLVKILNRMPARSEEEKTDAVPQAPAKGLYEVKRDEKGRIVAD